MMAGIWPLFLAIEKMNAQESVSKAYYPADNLLCLVA